MNLDTNRILNTDSKVLSNALVELSNSGNTFEAAQKYKDLYKDRPLSFIIENSDKIFVEPRQGLEFYGNKMKYFPLYTLCDELCKVTNYVHDHKDNMHPMLAKSYGDLINRLRSRIHETNCFGTIEDVIIKRDPNCRAKIMALCELLTKAGDDHQDRENGDADRERIEAFNKINKLVLVIHPVESLIYICVSPRGKSLRFCARNIAKSLESDEFAKTMESAIYMNMLKPNELFQEAVHSITSMDARCILEGLADVNVIDEFNSYTESFFPEDSDGIEVTLDNFVESTMVDLLEDKMDDEFDVEKKELLMRDKLAIYESVLDITTSIYERYESDEIMPEFPVFTQIKESCGIFGDVTVEDGLKVIAEATAIVEEELDTLVEEYTIDGRPGDVVSRHSAGTRYNEDITKGVTDHPKAGAPTKSGADHDSETIPASSRFGSSGMPDSSDPNAKRPMKPRLGVTDRVANKAMDINAAGKHKVSKIKAAGQGIVNAGKAVLKVPSGILKGLGNFTKFIGNMDENRRKEYMIRPGFRKKIFKNLRVAAMYGATFQVGKIYLPIAWYARKMSKEKNKRLRNEFVAELETEIKVTEAKIEDAIAKGDQEQRYNLIRIKDKLTRDMERVKYNSKYI